MTGKGVAVCCRWYLLPDIASTKKQKESRDHLSRTTARTRYTRPRRGLGSAVFFSSPLLFSHLKFPVSTSPFQRSSSANHKIFNSLSTVWYCTFPGQTNLSFCKHVHSCGPAWQKETLLPLVPTHAAAAAANIQLIFPWRKTYTHTTTHNRTWLRSLIISLCDGRGN